MRIEYFRLKIEDLRKRVIHLKKISDSLHNQIGRFSYKSLQNKSHLQSSARYHRQIINAMKAKDKTLACRLMKEHVLAAQEVLLARPGWQEENLEKTPHVATVMG